MTRSLPSRRTARTTVVTVAAVVVLAGSLLGCSGGGGGPVSADAATAAAAVGASAAAEAVGDDADGARAPGGGSGVREAPVQACDVLTRDIATQVLGPVADLPTAATTGTADDDLAVTSCSYLAEDGEEGTRDAVGVVVRTALSADGLTANRDRFTDDERPADAEPVEGLGDQAFWSPAVGQLNVLAAGQWYIVTFGGLDPRGRSLDATLDATQVLTGTFDRTPPES